LPADCAAAVAVSNDGQLWAAAQETWLDANQERIAANIYICSGSSCELESNWEVKKQSANLAPDMVFRGMVVSG
jgi:hypothetical protein